MKVDSDVARSVRRTLFITSVICMFTGLVVFSQGASFAMPDAMDDDGSRHVDLLRSHAWLLVLSGFGLLQAGLALLALRRVVQQLDQPSKPLGDSEGQPRG